MIAETLRPEEPLWEITEKDILSSWKSRHSGVDLRTIPRLQPPHGPELDAAIC